MIDTNYIPTLPLTEQDKMQGWVEYNGQVRMKSEIWTRVMGYHRPVSHYNIGKKAEYCSRNHFAEQNAKLESYII